MRLPTLLLPIAAIALAPITASAGTAARPNVVVIISDDGGFADWEFMDDYIQTINPGQVGSPVPTPNLNTLRDRGVLFTNAYTASVCSPSRACIVTGSYQQRIGYEYNINNLSSAAAADGLHPDVVTIFERMKAEGYTTGAIGKWHLGARAPDAGLGNRPENQGVDEFFGIWKGSRNYTVGSTNGDLEFTFHRTDAAATLPYHVEYGNNLTQWDPANHDTAGITITTIDKGPTDAITVSLPAALANGESALFVRLVVAP